MKNEAKNIYFTTDDGYKLTRVEKEGEPTVWTDGDLSFVEDEDGHPMDELRERLDGVFSFSGDITTENLEKHYPFMSDEKKSESVHLIRLLIKSREEEITDAIKEETKIANLAHYQAPIIIRDFANLSKEQEQEIRDRGDGNIYGGDTYIGQTIFGVKDNLQPIEDFVQEIKNSSFYNYFVETVSNKAEGRIQTDKAFWDFSDKFKTLEDVESAIAPEEEAERNMEAEIIEHLSGIFIKLNLDKPSNFDNLVEFMVKDVEESADPVDYHNGDFDIAFRRALEHGVVNDEMKTIKEAKKEVPTATHDDILQDFCRIANLAQLEEHYLTFEDGDIIIREATSNDEEVMRMSQNFFNQHSKYRVEIESTSTKGIDFNDNEKIIYTPENWDNNEKEGYTGKDFLDLCGGSEKSAGQLFESCTWQHPETVLDEMEREFDEDVKYNESIKTEELKKPKKKKSTKRKM